MLNNWKPREQMNVLVTYARYMQITHSSAAAVTKRFFVKINQNQSKIYYIL